MTPAMRRRATIFHRTREAPALDRVPCPYCRGAGTLLLADHAHHHARALAEIRRRGCDVSPTDIAPALGVSPNNAANMCAELERLGLLTSRRDGRRKYYRPAVTP